MPTTRRIVKDYERIHTNCVKGLTNYLNRYPNLESLVIGLSGGIDSALTAALVNDTLNALDREVGLIGYGLPLYTNKQEETDRADLHGDAFCDHYTETRMTPVMPDLVRMIDNSLFHEWISPSVSEDTSIRVGNIKARLRMMYLYDKASKYKGMVLSTDNYTEYLLGFWTLHGDVGDFGIIQNLWKTEVYGLAEWMVSNKGNTALSEVLAAKPTDGLGVNDDGDLGQLLPDWEGSYRGGYEFIDEMLIAFVSGDSYIKAGETELPFATMLDHRILQRHAATNFKRENPTNLSRAEVIS